MCAEKPPLGIMPKVLYEEIRIREIIHALARYTETDNLNAELMLVWSRELVERLEGLRRA